MRLAPSSSTLAALCASLAALALTGPALANGRYPAAGQIAVSPSKPDTILVRATYGLLFSTNVGQSWQWICEPAVGFSSVEDPMMAFTADGTLLAGIFEGLSIGTPDGCSWSFAPGGLVNKYVIDVAIDKVDPTQGVLIISNSVGQDDAGAPIFLTQLWQTADSGKTWTQAGVDLPPQFLGLTVDTAPSDPMRVYLSGRYGPPDYPGVIERSDDRGATWQKLPIPGADSTHLPYIGAVDPHNPDILYVRLDSDPSDTLLVSIDGGMTWKTAVAATGKLMGFALSPDGATVATGGPMDGVLTAPSSTLAFTKASKVGPLCLTWTPAGLYACADEFVDMFTAGISTDQGKTFTPLMHLATLCGPLACGADTEVGMMCPALWEATAQSIYATCGDAGPSASSSSSSSSGTTGTGSKSCSCALPGAAGGGMAAGALSLAGVFLALSRRRGKQKPAASRRR
jgi:hypothetical protein